MPIRVFIGSSSESLDVVSKIETQLSQRNYIVSRWDESSNPSVIVLLELARLANDCDFGIFVFSADDTTTSRNSISASVRDNVILETGIFIGSLGPHRTFLLEPQHGSPLHIPSDFSGLVITKYSKPLSRGGTNSLTSAVNRIEKRMATLGPALRNTFDEIMILHSKLRETIIECTDGLMTVSQIIEPVACEHSRAWSVLSRPLLLMKPLQETYDDSIIGQVYWWLIVEGVFKFRDIEQFGEKDWNWYDCIGYAEVSSRGAAYLNGLRAQSLQPAEVITKLNGD